MADIIIVRCFNCGESLGEISYIPGVQKIGCKECGLVTRVTIKKDGQVFTGRP